MNVNSRIPGGAGTQGSGLSPLVSFRAYLAARGLRLTAQRRLVLQGAFQRSRHFTAEELHEEFHDAGASVSLSTVYRTLGLLSQAGLIKEVLQCRGMASYEAVFGQAHHDHMLCVRCGKVIEFRDNGIEELQRRICREHGFTATEHRLGIRGICRECRAAEQRED